MSTQPFVLAPGDRPRALNVLSAQITVLATAAQTGSVEIFFESGAEGAGPPPHSHDWDEAFYVLRGEIHYVVDGEAGTAGPGAIVFVPGGTVHEFAMGAAGADVLSLTSRPGASDLFTALDREAGAASESGTAP